MLHVLTFILFLVVATQMQTNAIPFPFSNVLVSASLKIQNLQLQQQFRNELLRVYLSTLQKNQILFFSEIYHKCLSNFNNAHLIYHSLTEEEKDFVENILSLFF